MSHRINDDEIELIEDIDEISTSPSKPVRSQKSATPQANYSPSVGAPLDNAPSANPSLSKLPPPEIPSASNQILSATGDSPFNGELSGEPTRIESPSSINPEPKAKVVVIGGNDRGKEFILGEGNHILGRAVNNAVVLADIAVSRRHTMIAKEGDHYVVQDLKSGNGTLVNSKKIDTRILQDGDQIELGNTLLRFVLPQEGHLPDAKTVVGQMPDAPLATLPDDGVLDDSFRTMNVEKLPDHPKGRPLDRRKKLLIFGGSAVVFLLLIMVVIKVFVLKPKEKPKKKNQIADVVRYIERGAHFLKKKKWEEARREYLKVYALDPSSKGAKVYAEQAAQEIQARDAMKEATLSIQKEEFASARNALTKVHAESVYQKDAVKLKQKCDDLEVSSLIKKAKELKDEDADGAIAKLKAAQKIAPTNEIIKTLLEEVKELKEKSETSTPKDRAEKTPHGKKSDRSITIRGSGAYKKALIAYRKKEWGNAQKEILSYAKKQKRRKKKKVLRVAKAMKIVGLNYARAMSIQSSNPGKALGYYKSAIKADAKIPGKPHQKTLKKLAFKVARIQANSAFIAGNYTSCYYAIKQAKYYGSLDSTLKGLLKKLDKKAMELFAKGYTKRSTAPKQAKAIWRNVLKMVPPSSPAYKKAKSWLSNKPQQNYGAQDED